MKTPEQEAKEAEERNKDLIARTSKIKIGPKTFANIRDIKQEQAIIQKDFAINQRREADLIDFVLEQAGIERKDLESINITDDSEVVAVKRAIPVKEPVVDPEKEAKSIINIEKIKEEIAANNRVAVL